MIPAELIEKKRDGIELTPREIDWFIHNVMSEKIDDCQISALLMSIYFNGMTNIETKSLVNSMVKSGKRFNFKHLGKYVADKHSTGGIGDKISFILAPLLSSFGIIVPMIAGRGLAFTGGTIDKLESIKNFQTQKNFDSFNNQIDLIGCGIISQSSEICPADKKLYSIRDLTGTIPSFPLICSSIMSKKLAEGLDGLVMDVKVGNGAFMKNFREAKSLGIELKKIGDSFDIDVSITYSNMSEPLGKYAGLKCEIIEAVDCLRGTGPDDVTQLSLDLCANILVQSGISANKSEAKTSLLKNKLSLKNFKWSLEKLSIILQPFVPHISEEIWSSLGNQTLCISESWHLEDVIKKSEIKIAIQINGKTKEIIEIEDKISKEKVLETVKHNNKIKKNILGKNIVREIYVPGKIVNLVIK